jgi:hypothetical protein
MIEQYIVNENNSNKKGIVKIGTVFVNFKKIKNDFNKVIKQSGGFNHIYSLLPNEQNEKPVYNNNSINNLNKYIEYLEKIIPKKANSDDEYNKKYNDLLKCSLYTLIMSQYIILPIATDNIYKYKLSGNSANALMKIIKTQNLLKNKEEELIIKVQIHEKADDLLIDSVNARIINEIINKNENLNKNLMTYVASFVNYIEEIQKDPYIYGIFFKIYLNKLEQSTDNIEPKKCFVANAIKHFTLRKMVDDMEIRDLNILLNNKILINFINNLIFLGENYGFVHNDCHLGNILFDTKNLQLVLIDYGLVYFDFDKLNDKLKDNIFTNEIFKNEQFKLTDTMKAKYKDNSDNFDNYQNKKILDDYSNIKHKPTYVNPYTIKKILKQFNDNDEIKKEIKEEIKEEINYYINNMVLFDISTIVMNILAIIYIEKGIEENIEEYKKLLNFNDLFNIYIQNKDNNTLDNYYHLYITLPKKMILSTDKSIFQNIGDNDNIGKLSPAQSIFHLGITIFFMYVYSCLIKLFKGDTNYTTILDYKKNSDNTFTFNFTKFVKEIQVMYHSFQYIDIIQPDVFAQLLYANRDLIEKLKSRIKDSDTPRSGGGESYPVKPVNLPVNPVNQGYSQGNPGKQGNPEKQVNQGKQKMQVNPGMQVNQGKQKMQGNQGMQVGNPENTKLKDSLVTLSKIKFSITEAEKTKIAEAKFLTLKEKKISFNSINKCHGSSDYFILEQQEEEEKLLKQQTEKLQPKIYPQKLPNDLEWINKCQLKKLHKRFKNKCEITKYFDLTQIPKIPINPNKEFINISMNKDAWKVQIL